MKIYKPTFETFIDEAVEPIYIHELNTEKQSDNLTINRRVTVSLTAWNEQDHVVALMIDAGTYLYGDMKMDERVHAQAERIKQDIMSRLRALRIKYVPGMIHDKSLYAAPYQFADLRLQFDLDTAIGSDPDGNPLTLNQEVAS